MTLDKLPKTCSISKKQKTQWSQAVRKRLVFAILLNVSLKQTRSVAMRWNPKTRDQFSKSRVPIKGPMHSQIDLQESQNVYFRVKLRAKKCRKLLSSNWNLKHHYLWARAQEMPKMSLVICRWIQTSKWILHGSRKTNISTHAYRRITSDGPKSIFLGHAGFGKFRKIFLEASKWAFSGQCLECGQWDSGRNH